MRRTLITLGLVVLVALAGCTGTQHTEVGDAEVKVNADSITLGESETANVEVGVAENSNVDWVTVNVLEEPDGLNTQIPGKKLEPGENTTVEITSEENVEMMTIMVMCGKTMCPIMVPSYDGHDVTLGLRTSGNATETVNIEVEA